MSTTSPPSWRLIDPEGFPAAASMAAGLMACDFPRRTFEPGANDLDARACRTTAGRVADFKRRHGLARGDRLSEPARALLLQELEADKRAAMGEQLAQAQALALIAERATLEAAQALAAIVPEQHRLFHAETGWVTAWQTEPYLLNRVEALTGKRYATPGAAWKRAAALAPAAAPAAPAERFRRILFWGVILRLDQLEGPPPADPRAFYSWCQLGAYQRHNTGPSLSDLLAGRMQETEARALLQLPTSGPLEGAAIRTAYRAQARTAHPDAGGDRQRFEQLSQARDRLLLLAPTAPELAR